jgi:hypothetical protein
MWHPVRPCGLTGDPGDLFYAKSVSTLEIVPQEDGAMMRPRESSGHQPDVLVGTDDWDAPQGFLCDIWDIPEQGKDTAQEPLSKWHIRVVL